MGLFNRVTEFFRKPKRRPTAKASIAATEALEKRQLLTATSVEGAIDEPPQIDETAQEVQEIIDTTQTDVEHVIDQKDDYNHYDEETDFDSVDDFFMSMETPMDEIMEEMDEEKEEAEEKVEREIALAEEAFWADQQKTKDFTQSSSESQSIDDFFAGDPKAWASPAPHEQATINIPQQMNPTGSLRDSGAHLNPQTGEYQYAPENMANGSTRTRDLLPDGSTRVTTTQKDGTTQVDIIPAKNPQEKPKTTTPNTGEQTPPTKNNDTAFLSPHEVSAAVDQQG